MSSIQTAGELKGLACGGGGTRVSQIKPLSDGHTLTVLRVGLSSSHCIKSSRQQNASESQLCVFFLTFLASHDTHRQPTQVEEDHKTLGQTHSVYRTEVGAIEGNINPQKKREESVAHMVQFYVYTLSLYLASSLRVSFPPLFPSQYSVASPPRAWRDPALLDGLRGSEHCEAWRAAKAPHAASQCPRASIHLFSQSERTPSARLCSGSR